MAEIPTVALPTGGAIPQLGLGTYAITGPTAAATIASGIAAGYRLLDTAASYDNEVEVGAGIRLSETSRADLFITTKIGRGTPGAAAASVAVREACERLRLDRIDLVLIHAPHDSREIAVDTWRGLIRTRDEGIVSSVGVSNFAPHQLRVLHEETGEWPAVNQVQLSPALQRRDDVDFHREHGIVSMAWSPLGVEHGVLTAPAIERIAHRHAVSPATIALRWGLQRGHVVIPKSSSAHRQRENLKAVDIALSREEMAALDALDTARESGWEAAGRTNW